MGDPGAGPTSLDLRPCSVWWQADPQASQGPWFIPGKEDSGSQRAIEVSPLVSDACGEPALRLSDEQRQKCLSTGSGGKGRVLAPVPGRLGFPECPAALLSSVWVPFSTLITAQTTRALGSAQLDQPWTNHCRRGDTMF